MNTDVSPFIQGLIEGIEKKIDLLELDRKQTLPVKKLQRGSNIIFTWNISGFFATLIGSLGRVLVYSGMRIMRGFI